MFSIILTGNTTAGEPFTTPVSGSYELKKDTVDAAEKLLRTGGGLGKVADEYEIVEQDATALASQSAAK